MMVFPTNPSHSLKHYSRTFYHSIGLLNRNKNSFILFFQMWHSGGVKLPTRVSSQTRCLLEVRARSRVAALIEYVAQGAYLAENGSDGHRPMQERIVTVLREQCL
jgi:hypothetical protein